LFGIYPVFEGEEIMRYSEQLKRTIRSFNKLPREKVLKKIDPRTIDNYYHFFQDCYHLKDWIKNDGSVKKEVSDVEEYINKSSYLKIIAGIAIAAKHLKITRKQREYALGDATLLNTV